MSSLKRKRVNITIQQKLDILRELEKGKSAKQLAFEYNIGCSTVHDIKKNKSKLLNYTLLASQSIYGSENRKTMKKSPYELLDKALIHWFNNERAQGIAITGPMCAKQAKILFNTIGLPGNFDASSGWLARFKDRYGIRSVGNSLDCVWTIGVAEPEIFEGEIPVLENDEKETPILENEEGETQIEYETIEMECGDEDILEDEFTTLHVQPTVGEVHPEDRSMSDEVTPNCLISPDLSCQNFNSQVEKSLQTQSGSKNVSERKAMEYEIKNLKYLVEKLEIVTKKLTDMDDSYDNYGRYISLLLKRLPPKKVLYLKQKIVSDVLQSVLAHEKGIPEESFSSCNHEFNIYQSKTKTLPKKKLLDRSKVSVNNDTNNTRPYNDVSNVSRLSGTTTTKKKNISANMTIDTQNNRCFPLPCSYGNLMPDGRLQASSGKVISDDHSHFLIQKSVNNNESAKNVSYSSHTYFPEMSVDVTPGLLDTISSDRTDRHQKCIEHTTNESNEEGTTIQYGPNEDSNAVALEESIKLKTEEEIDETVAWDTSFKVKVEGSCQNEELDERLPDFVAVELINCGLCSTKCASKDILIQHFTQFHSGCVPISRERSVESS